jgi:hypothetical protein
VGRERGTRLVRAALRATPTMRMAPSRSNFPYPAPTVASKREEKAVTSGRLIAYQAMGQTSFGTAKREASAPLIGASCQFHHGWRMYEALSEPPMTT